MYHWRDRFLFKKRYLHQAHDFYEKHGGLAVIGARFLPFIRTFAPIVAGIVQMDRKKFHFYNVIGCIAWVTTMVLGGFFLQKWILNQFGFDLKEHLEIIVLGIVLVTTAPVIIKKMSGGKKKEISFINSAIGDTDRLNNLVENALMANLIDHKGYSFSKEDINISALLGLMIQKFQQIPGHEKIELWKCSTGVDPLSI